VKDKVIHCIHVTSQRNTLSRLEKSAPLAS